MRHARPIALGTVAGCALLAYSRALVGAGWVVPALTAAWLPMGAVLWLRARGLLQPLRALAVLAVGTWFIVLVVFPRETYAGLPLPHAVAVAATAGMKAWGRMQMSFSPVPPDAGYLVLLLAASWLAGWASAVVLESRAGAAAPLPWLGVFVFASAVGAPAGRRLFLLAFLASVVGLLFVETWARAESFAKPAWPLREPGKGPGTGDAAAVPQLRPAARVAAISLIAALTLPGLLSVPAASSRHSGAPGAPSIRTTISPIVQIGPRLTQRPVQVLFTVTATRPAYWRLIALDRFDGEIWSANSRYRAADGPITLARPPASATGDVRQLFHIKTLGGTWLPAAYAPSRVSGIDVGVDPLGGTLATSTLRSGMSYEVVSRLPAPTAQELAGAGVGSEVSATFLDLPDELSPPLSAIAQGITAGAVSAYEKALALQAELRTFAYREDLPPERGEAYLLRFLTEVRAGYCEQFAGAMAAMLRALGIPSRVVVGFLPGARSGGSFTVTTRDAHAWPEAYFDGVGWVAFEPTPRSGVEPPGYTQAPPETSPEAGSAPEPASADARSGAGNLERREELDTETSSRAPARADRADVARRATGGILAVLVCLLALLFGARELRIRLMGALAGSPRRRVWAAYREFLFRAADAVRSCRPGETELEYAHSIAASLSLPDDSLRAVVAAFQKAEYSGSPIDEAESVAAGRCIRALRWKLWRSAGWLGRGRLLFSPRPLIPRASALRRASRAGGRLPLGGAS